MNAECPATFPVTLVGRFGRRRLIVRFDPAAGLSLRRLDARVLLSEKPPALGQTFLGTYVDRRSSPWLRFFPFVRVSRRFRLSVI